MEIDPAPLPVKKYPGQNWAGSQPDPCRKALTNRLSRPSYLQPHLITPSPVSKAFLWQNKHKTHTAELWQTQFNSSPYKAAAQTKMEFVFALVFLLEVFVFFVRVFDHVRIATNQSAIDYFFPHFTQF